MDEKFEFDGCSEDIGEVVCCLEGEPEDRFVFFVLFFKIKIKIK